MARIRQYNTNRYASSDAVQAEFENLFRYLNAAEVGNKALSELMTKLFDANGEVSLGLEFRYDPVNGLEVSVSGGEWVPVVAADDIRGAPGQSLGFIDGPVFFNRQDYVATSNQQVFDYTINETLADVVVFVNGLLLPTAGYTWSAEADQVTLADPVALNGKVTIYSVRNNASSTYRRTDFQSGANQVLFPFPHTESEIVQVYRNGILQREGSGHDYVKSVATSTITMTTPQPADTIISVIVVQNEALRGVLGLMLEDNYTQDGLIRLDRIAMADGAIAQAKVAGLTAALALRADCYVSSTQPAAPVRPGSLWLDTSGSVPRLFVFDGSLWFDPSPQGMLPKLTASDAMKFLRVNGTASGLEPANFDLSGVVFGADVGAPSGVAGLDTNGRVPNGQLPRGLANGVAGLDGDSQVPVGQLPVGEADGVAGLDSASKVPVAQLPDITRRTIVSGKVGGAVTNSTVHVGLLAGSNFTIDAASFVLAAGSCTVQLQVGGVNVGTPVAVTTTAAKGTWTAAAISAAAVAGLPISLVITAASGASDLLYCVQGMTAA